MKNRFIIFYTIFAIIAFTFAVFFFGINLYTEYSNGNARTAKKYENIVNTVKLNSNNSISTINTRLNESISSLNDFSYISVKLNDTEIYRYPVNLEKNQTSSNLTTSYERMVKTESGTYLIDCNMYLLRPASIVYFAKITFLIILIVTLITIILIVYLNMTEQAVQESSISVTEESSTVSTSPSTSEPAVITQKEESENDESIDISDINEPAETTLAQNETPAAETTVIQSTEVTVEQEISDNSNEPVFTEDDDEPQAEEKIMLPNEEEKPSELSGVTSTSPSGLFNPETGFGWESYLMTRLDNEINRAIASEIDFSLFVFELPDLPRTSEVMKNVCNYLSIQFQFKDLLFEYKNDCLVAMKISMNIDEALNFADKLYADIKEIIQDKDCFIGISTRSIRMVSGERLIHEADQALVHAKEDDSPIIAFRVDAEKYRQYLEQNNK